VERCIELLYLPRGGLKARVSAFMTDTHAERTALTGPVPVEGKPLPRKHFAKPRSVSAWSANCKLELDHADLPQVNFTILNLDLAIWAGKETFIPYFLRQKLSSQQFCVDPISLHQFLMASLFSHSPVLQNEDQVRSHHG
jgi:hypothetical protein